MLPPTAWVRMWIPQGGRQHQRAYTITRVNREQATAIILVLHHEPSGPASRWSKRVKPGATVSVQVMGGTSYRLPSPGDKMLLVGDQASAPALADAVAASPPSSLATVVMLAPETGFCPWPHATIGSSASIPGSPRRSCWPPSTAPCGRTPGTWLWTGCSSPWRAAPPRRCGATSSPPVSAGAASSTRPTGSAAAPWAPPPSPEPEPCPTTRALSPEPGRRRLPLTTGQAPTRAPA